MPVEKLAISVDPDLASSIRALADASGDSVSGWLADAARRKMRDIAAISALKEFEKEFGAISAEELEAAANLWLE